MNKIIKTFGLTTALTGALFTSSMKANNYIDNTTSSHMEVVNKDVDKFSELEILSALAGLGILSVASLFYKKIHDFKQIPYSNAHTIINDTYYIINRNKYKKEEILRTIDNNQYALYKLLNSTKIYDIAAAEQCKFTYGAMKHSVLHHEKVDETLKIKTQYLFDKAVSPHKYFKKLHQQYVEEYPLIDFDKNYGIITFSKFGTYAGKTEPLLYEGLKNKVVANELRIMLNNIVKETNSINFYTHDRENLISKINMAAYYIRRNQTIPDGLLTEINDIYHTKILKKHIDIK